MSESSAESDARRRIEAAFSPKLIGECGRRLADRLAKHFQSVEASQESVLNWASPPENVVLAQQSLQAPAPDPAVPSASFHAVLRERFDAAVEQILARGNNLHHPRYIGHQVPASSPIAALFDAVGSATNQVMAIYEMGPWATAVERAVIEQVGQVLGLPQGGFAGLITHGGTLANLTGLLTARNVSLSDAWEGGVARPGRPPVLLVHSDAHYGIVRSAGVLGLGTRQVLRVPLDNRRRMAPAALDQMIRDLKNVGQPVVAVCACACATPIGAFDPLEAIADVCESHGVWLHVDAAHGGPAAFSERYRHLVAGLERADSIVCDAHKMMFVPALCALLFYKNPAHQFAAFRQEAPYLFDPSTPHETAAYDSGLMTIECTKRAAAFGLWGLWSLFGQQLFADMVETTFDLGQAFHELLRAADDFEPLHEPECNIVAFRYEPQQLQTASPEQVGEFQREVRRRLIESGEFYIVQTNLEGRGALRVTIINPLTTLEDLSALLEAIRHAAQPLLA
jgi:L-2,4-diaminobutyrate decarboxylase